MSESRLEGVAALTKKLNELDAKLAAKTLRGAALSATLPAFQKMKASAPIGSEAHRTYKGRLVAPGFLKRSIRRVTRIKNAVISVIIGVRREAFYGVMFIEKGTKKMSAQPWFEKSFESERDNMERRLASELEKRIERIARK